MYSTVPSRIVHIRKIKETNNIDTLKPARKTNKKDIRFMVGLIVTYAMTALFLLSFITILVFIFVFPGRDIPAILHDSFIALLGYFGGTFVAFVKTSNEGE